MLIDLTRRAPFLLADECPRSIAVRTVSVIDIATSRVVGHTVVEPITSLKQERLTFFDFSLPLEIEKTSDARQRFLVTTARRSDRDWMTWVLGQYNIELRRHLRLDTTWYVDIFRSGQDMDMCAARVSNILPGIIEVGLAENRGKSSWDHILEETSEPT